MSEPRVLTGELVELRRVVEADVEQLLELWASDPTVLERWPTWTREDVRSSIEGTDGDGGWWILDHGDAVGYIQHYQELDAEYRHAGMASSSSRAARGAGSAPTRSARSRATSSTTSATTGS